MMILFKKSNASYCYRTRENKGPCEGEVNYLVSGYAKCKKHAEEECQRWNAMASAGGSTQQYQLPVPDQFLAGASKEVTDAVKLIKENLRIEVRTHGGCPEENFPPDVDLYLVLGDEVIAEARI